MTSSIVPINLMRGRGYGEAVRAGKGVVGVVVGRGQFFNGGR